MQELFFMHQKGLVYTESNFEMEVAMLKIPAGLKYLI